MPATPTPTRIPIPDTPYSILTTGRGRRTTLVVVDKHGQPPPGYTLPDARKVAVALANAAVGLDGWPPYSQQPDTTTETRS